MSDIICLLNTQMLLQNEIIAVVHLAEGQFLKDGQTRSKTEFGRFLVRTRRPIMSMEDGQDLEPQRNTFIKIVNKNNNNNRFASQLNPRPKCSSTRSYQLDTEAHPEPGQTNPRPPTNISFKIHFHLSVRTESVVILSTLCALGLSEAVASFWISRPNFLLSQRN